MDWKKFLKPTRLKITITIILLAIYEAFIYYRETNRLIDCIGTCPTPYQMGITEVVNSFLNPSIILIIIIFYLVSCFLVYLKK